MSTSTIIAALAATLITFMSSAVWAQTGEGESTDEGVGLELELAVSSAYVFRGLNVFQKDGQGDQHAFVAPSVNWSVGDTGLSIGYWGAYQLTGDNRSENTDAALNTEQDLFATFEIEAADSLTVSPGLIYYFYPFADEDTVGTSMPSVLEPGVAISYASFVDFGLSVSYFYAVQEEIKVLRHLYVNPSIAKELELSGSMKLQLGTGFGYKKFDDAAVENNTYDVLVGLGLPIDVGGGATVKPNVNAAWTNLQNEEFSGEYVLWGGVALGLGL
jgi:hypothetical protein